MINRIRQRLRAVAEVVRIASYAVLVLVWSGIAVVMLLGIYATGALGLVYRFRSLDKPVDDRWPKHLTEEKRFFRVDGQ